MRYLGGKSRIAKEIAKVISPRGIWWEPFCGGLSVSTALAAYGPGLVSDKNQALISLYLAVRAGWDPPTTCSKEDWLLAKGLPDSDPRKAFAGFGCSFRGMWFQAFDPGGFQEIKSGPSKGHTFTLDRAGSTKAALLRDLPILSRSEIFQVDYCAVEPTPWRAPSVIYADPPYAGTTGYDAVSFDPVLFWLRCQQWARLGVGVYVSELACPVPHVVVWEKPYTQRMKNQNADGAQQVTERLFLIHA